MGSKRKIEMRKKRKEKLIENKTINHEFSVLATMSSGKSTVINALLGEDLLPNENQACTAKIFKIIDKDGANKTKIKVLKDNVVVEVENISLEELNQDSKISEIIIEKDLEGIENKIIGKENHQICLIDTPGPNNSLESSHAEIAYKLLEDDSSTHLIYVLNGTQIGVNDDKRLLIDIIEKQKEINDNKEIIFILNKMDEIDQESENIENIITNVKKYLENLGIKKPKIIPLSAYAAKLFKLGLKEKLNTRKERNDFKKYYSYFSEFQISNKEVTFKRKDKRIKIGKDKYSSNEIVKRIYATGIIDLEENLEKLLNKKIKGRSKEEILMKEELYVSVIATMSSGKSTLINAILEDELLPSKNEACTATICKIKDIDGLDEFRARVEDLEGNEIYSWKENISNKYLEKVNEEGNEKGLNIYVEGDIPGISSEDMSLVIIDIPGPNNSQNEDHKAAMYRYIKDNETNPLVLYVMNVTQHATNDDNRLLNEIAEIIQRKGKQAEERFLFALNKIDAFDVEKEDVEKLIENNKEYLRGKGIKNPKIFPISAEFSKLKKLEIKGKKLTRTQKMNLEAFKCNFMPDLDDDYEGIDTIKYASISSRLKKELYKEAKKDEDKGHLHYSGITAIEKYIEGYAKNKKRS